jgi:hypothetical protein
MVDSHREYGKANHPGDEDSKPKGKMTDEWLREGKADQWRYGYWEAKSGMVDVIDNTQPSITFR